MKGSGKVVCIRSAMTRRLATLNLESILRPDYETSTERYSLEISIRKIDGVDRLVYWRLDLGEFPMGEFIRSLRGWSQAHARYSAWVKIVNYEAELPLLEAPLQLSSSLDQWLTNHWGLSGARLTLPPDRSQLMRSCRVAVM